MCTIGVVGMYQIWLHQLYSLHCHQTVSLRCFRWVSNSEAPAAFALARRCPVVMMDRFFKTFLLMIGNKLLTLLTQIHTNCVALQVLFCGFSPAFLICLGAYRHPNQTSKSPYTRSLYTEKKQYINLFQQFLFQFRELLSALQKGLLQPLVFRPFLHTDGGSHFAPSKLPLKRVYSSGF